ncbi:MAG: methyl-accepting chemotaxis protein [Campylobacterota bacterium]|nr:methyl-accepting chemotaxis protein [Campylobacterota bacterium]
MLPDFITKKVGNKIIFSMFLLMTFSSIAILVSTVSKVSDNNIETTKKNLDMLNTAIFQSLRNAMNTGDPVQIKKAEDEARGITGVEHLTIAKSKPLIEMYSPDSKFTKDIVILDSFKTKSNQMIEVDNNDGHSLRMIKPMIATKDCLMCHANQSQGDIIGVMDLTFSLEDSDNDLKSITLAILIWSTALGWLTIGIIFYVVRSTIKPLDGLKQGFENLISSNDTNIKLKAQTNDEIGEVANLFNRYMDQVNEGLKRDEIVISETNDVLEKTANGFFVYEVTSSASNPHVEDMRKNLNFMIKSVKSTLDKINVTLRNYSQSKYDYKIDDRGIYGDLGAVTAGIKLVGNNTSEILAMILNTGDQLNNNTHILSKSSSDLANSVDAQAKSGRNTTESLDLITKTIHENTENTSEMSNLAKDVTVSAKSGKDLAKSTASAMDEIALKVNSINEAITVIDQIAFQTNILSLNAAVEAATAGEAGKGFAVVAQEVRNLASRSAEAAKDIKEIVVNATTKANNGKSIADDMINGYELLSANINNTIQLIENVSNSSKQQESSILKINTAVSRMDRSTKNNADVSKGISDISKEIETMSGKLVNAASKASFLQETRTQVCDIDLIYDIANLKVELFKYKDNVYSRLADKNDNIVKRFDKLDNWLDEYQRDYDNINAEIMTQLHEMNNNLYQYLTNLMNSSTNNEDNNTINHYAKQVEIESMRLFGTLNQIKEYRCKGK